MDTSSILNSKQYSVLVSVFHYKADQRFGLRFRLSQTNVLYKLIKLSVDAKRINTRRLNKSSLSQYHNSVYLTVKPCGSSDMQKTSWKGQMVSSVRHSSGHIFKKWMTLSLQLFSVISHQYLICSLLHSSTDYNDSTELCIQHMKLNFIIFPRKT